jgi:hypothetical protein
LVGRDQPNRAWGNRPSGDPTVPNALAESKEMKTWLLPVALVGLLSGCTSWALERSTIRHAESASALRYQEVLDNLAMIHVNQFALPAYSSIYAGAADVTDNLKATSATAWARTAAKPSGFMTAFLSGSIDVLGSRADRNTWTLDPTIVPEKLRAMRAACNFVLSQPVLEPDFNLLRAYRKGDDKNPPSPNGYYFAVEDQLLPLGATHWLHCETSRAAIPRCACYWSGCHGQYVWVGPEGMACLSQFSLILQSIARVNFGSVYYPQPQLNRTLVWQIPIDPHEPNNAPDPKKAATASVTVYLDQNGLLAPGNNQPAIPLKNRVDNVGQDSALKAVINVTSKSSM